MVTWKTRLRKRGAATARRSTASAGHRRPGMATGAAFGPARRLPVFSTVIVACTRTRPCRGAFRPSLLSLLSFNRKKPNGLEVPFRREKCRPRDVTRNRPETPALRDFRDATGAQNGPPPGGPERIRRGKMPGFTGFQPRKRDGKNCLSPILRAFRAIGPVSGGISWRH